MDPTFDLNIMVPHDARFAVTVGNLAARVAQSTGCCDADAQAFGRTVEEAVRSGLAGRGTALPVTVRCVTPVEVIVNDHAIRLGA